MSEKSYTVDDTSKAKEFVPTSSPKMTKAAIRAARRYAGVPDDMTDQDAIDRGFIPPEILSLFMMLFTDLLTNCLPNQPAMAIRRIRGYTQETNPFKKLGDDVRLRWAAHKWLNNLSISRERGDVVLIARVVAAEADGSKDEEILEIQNEAAWLGV